MNDIDIIQNQINHIKDDYIKSTCKLLYSRTERQKEEIRECGKTIRELEDRINNLSSVLIKKTDKKELERAIANII